LNIQLSICTAGKGKVKDPSHSNSYQSRINCLGQQLAILQGAESKMMDIDHQYATQPAIANAQKGKVYLDATKNTPRCD